MCVRAWEKLSAEEGHLALTCARGEPAPRELCASTSRLTLMAREKRGFPAAWQPGARASVTGCPPLVELSMMRACVYTVLSKQTQATTLGTVNRFTL